MDQEETILRCAEAGFNADWLYQRGIGVNDALSWDFTTVEARSDAVLIARAILVEGAGPSTLRKSVDPVRWRDQPIENKARDYVFYATVLALSGAFKRTRVPQVEAE